MKRIALIFAIIFLFAGLTFGQSSLTSDLVRSTNSTSFVYYTEAAVDSVDTLTTGVIYGDAFSDGILTGRILLSSASGKPRITIKRQSNFFGTWNDEKTLYTADSLETERASVLDTIPTYGQHRFVIEGAAGNRSDTSLKWLIKFKR